MFEKLGTPKFIANARAQGKRYTPMGVFFVFLLLFSIGGMLQSAILSPVLFVMMLADPTYYEIVNGQYATTEEMYEQIMLYTQALNEKPAVVVTTLLATAGTVAACLVYLKFIEKRSLASAGMTRKGAVPAYLRGALFGLVLFAVAIGFSALFGGVTFVGFNKSFNPLLFVLLLVGYVIQGFSEEILCRGVLMVSTAKSTRLSVALWSSALAFAALHTLNHGFAPLPFINLVLFGLLMGLYMIRGGSIWGAAALHTVWNFAEGVLTSFSVSGMKMPTHLLTLLPVEGKELFIGGAFGPEGGLGVTFVLAVSLALLAMTPTKNSIEEKAEAPTVETDQK